MGKTVVVDALYLAHEGGTKFYEILMLTNSSAKKFLEIRRWASNDKFRTGKGQTQRIVHASAAAMADSAAKQIKAKGKGGYSSSKQSHGFHGSGGTLSEKAVLKTLPVHYSDPSDCDEIRRLAAIDESGDLEGQLADEFVTPVPEEPVDRGVNWGSW